MDPIKTGKAIATLRKNAGYTQASLADTLGITDKAVSKWECGKGLPDPSLLPHLSKILDCDVEVLILGVTEYCDKTWQGRLVITDDELSPDTQIFDKPLIHYLISYFMLVGIKNIEIICNSDWRCFIKTLELEKFGLNISFTQTKSSKTMIVYGKNLVFGCNLTRLFQNAMLCGNNAIPVVDGIELPIVFSVGCDDINVLKKISERRKLGRGIVNIPLNTVQQVNDAADFVRIYQKYHGMKIADLFEIAQNRGFIDSNNI